MKKWVPSVLLSITAMTAFSQVPQKVIVEHFTNTRCGICASRNPGFYSNLSNHPDVLHISFHPSSPYSNCVLNNHNMSENDARTNYYNNFGSTPKFVVQGDRITGGTDVTKPELFTPYSGMNSPIQLRMAQSFVGTDSIRSEIIITTVATHSLGNLKLFVGVAEDTVFYNAPNGEQEHYDVFREAMSNILGDDITVPTNVGDSISVNFSLATRSEWNLNRMFTVAILQDAADKSVVQAEATNAEMVGTPVGLTQIESSRLSVFPNPTSGMIRLSNLPDDAIKFELYSQSGQLVQTIQLVNENSVELILPEGIQNGLYLGKLLTQTGFMSEKILLQR